MAPNHRRRSTEHRHASNRASPSSGPTQPPLSGPTRPAPSEATRPAPRGQSSDLGLGFGASACRLAPSRQKHRRSGATEAWGGGSGVGACRIFALLALCVHCRQGVESTPASGSADGFRAGLVFDVGGVDDKSFNEAAHRGLMRAKSELGIDVQYYQPSQPADRKTGLRQLAKRGANVIIGVGFIFSDELMAMARDFPELKFACIDMVDKPEGTLPPNLLGLKFREEQGAFLAGALAAAVTKTKKVGFVGGMNVPLIQKFEAGYRAGVKHVAPEVEVMVNYAGETPKAFEDPETGKNRAVEQYKSGADIIFHASGKTGLGVFQAAKELDKLVIGADADQYREAPGHVLTSVIKSVETVVLDTIRKAKEGRFQGGQQVVLGLKENGVGIVYNEHNQDLIPLEVYQRVMRLREEIIAGKIPVSSTR